MAARVATARDRAWQRQGCSNAMLDAAGIEQHAHPQAAALALLQQAATRLGWSGRGYHCVLKEARSIADLAGAHEIGSAHMAEALQLRRGLPGLTCDALLRR